MSKVFFHYADRKLNIPGKNDIKSLIESIFNQEKKSLQRIDYVFCSDEYLLDINKAHLQHDYYTDIITFDLSDNNKTTAEIYISLDRIAENAQILNQPLKNETLRVIIHGALHLCGYKDKRKDEKHLMRQMEDKYIDVYSTQ